MNFITRTTILLSLLRFASSLSISPSDSNTFNTRRKWLLQSAACLPSGILTAALTNPINANAAVEEQVTQEELDALQPTNPDIPAAPEERSGLVVLRVAEVAQFQEKILMAKVSGELSDDLKISPMQFQFGTQILLKNSKIDGNMKLMIDEDIPKNKRKDAVSNAVSTMNIFQDIAKYAGSIDGDFTNKDMTELAEMYRAARANLNQLYEFLPQREKDKYYGYFAEVTAYEKKVAQGTYNPDIDGVLKFD